jgi:putative ABC transport system permease protein
VIVTSLRIAARALARNKGRSALTMLGVIIGVAAVIAMVAIGQGAARSVQQQIASMGNDMFMILPGSTSTGGVQQGVGTVPTLSPGDAATIEESCPSCGAVAVVIRARGQLVYLNANWSPATVQGCDPDFLLVRDWPLDEGEAFTDQDVKSQAQVCLVGHTVEEKLFGGESALGKSVRLKNLPFRIVGVLARKGGNTSGVDQDDVVLLPWTTCKTKVRDHSAFNTVDQILVSAPSSDLMSSLGEEIKDALRENHHCPENERGGYDDDFTIRNMTEVMNAMASTTQTMTTLLAAVASVSLLVGGIGIMNIMLVSVTERTREIGLREAVGARPGDILWQFLVEAVVLSAIGGLAGIGVGGALAMAIARFAHWPAVLSWHSVAVAVFFSAAVGVFFGFYPAWRASQLDPIDALRYE